MGKKASLVAGVVAGLMWCTPLTASASTKIDLGTAKKYAVLAGQGVTNTGPSVMNGALGTYPNGAMTGFPPGLVNGPVHRADAAALQAKSDLTTAYNAARGQSGTAIPPQLGGTTLTPGDYNGGALNLTGVLTLNGAGVYIITATSSLTTATGSSVSLINGANPCNVFWQVSSSASLLGSDFVGTVMALTSITVGNGVTATGRLLARNGDVSLINDVVNASQCGANTTTPSPKARFVGPCGEPLYAAVFINKTSKDVTFDWYFVSFSTRHIVHISKTVAAGKTFETAFHHVLGSTRMWITSGGHVLKSIRSAPPGNYGACPN